MKIIRDGNSRLEVLNAYYWPAIGVLFGVGYLCQELPKFFHGQEHFSDRNSDVGLAVAVLFIVVGLLLCNRFRLCLDQTQQTLIWTRTTVLGTKTRAMPLGKVRAADFEVSANAYNNHPQWGPLKRVVIRTEEGLLPMAGGYSYSSKSGDRAVAAVNEFLGIRVIKPSGSSDDAIRILIAEGSINQAIAAVCEREHCPPSKARQIVNQMMESDF